MGCQGYPHAGNFSSWLLHMRRSLAEGKGIAVPCGSCNACCRSSYFIHVGPGERRALARIPEKLLFAAPGRPKDDLVMGYGRGGRCPLLVNGKCSIYRGRPLTCRSYDCRIFAAAGISAGDGKLLVTKRARQWIFGYHSNRDRDLHSAVQSAARFLRDHPECLPAGATPGNPLALAILAVKVHEVFLGSRGSPGKTMRAPLDIEMAKAIRAANEYFDAVRDTR
jgi:uncharacterized protein